MTGADILQMDLLAGSSRILGSKRRGRMLQNGTLEHEGAAHSIPGLDIWKLAEEQPGLSNHLHGFSWLDDLRRAGGADAMELAKAWLFDWIDARHGLRSPLFAPDLAGRRIISWVRNIRIVRTMLDERQRDELERSIRMHAEVLASARMTGRGTLHRFEILAGRICAEAANGKRGGQLAESATALARECKESVLPESGIASRNPEELFRILQQLAWAASSLDSCGGIAQDDHADGISTAAGILRQVRHCNGTLGRFHGGRDLPVPLVDRFVVHSVSSLEARSGAAMGYARMMAGQTSILMDVDAPPAGAASSTAHASTLAFEASSANCRLVVNCGSAAAGRQEVAEPDDARSADRHSSVEVRGVAAARLNLSRVLMTGHPDIENAATEVRRTQLPGRDGWTIISSHNGYVPSFGLTHMRRLDLGRDGSRLWGEDTIWAKDRAGRLTHARSLSAGSTDGLEIIARFHLHPDSNAQAVKGNGRIEIWLPDGQIWEFRFEGPARLELADSLYRDESMFRVRPSSQIVLHSRTQDGAAQLRWEFARRPASV